jgi:hypothetical protein
MRKRKITPKAQSVVARDVIEGLEELRNGRTHGPYITAKEAIAALEKGATAHANMDGK